MRNRSGCDHGALNAPPDPVGTCTRLPVQRQSEMCRGSMGGHLGAGARARQPRQQPRQLQVRLRARKLFGVISGLGTVRSHCWGLWTLQVGTTQAGMKPLLQEERQ